jgi:crotonobetainyl-CoA:carnitine CoA-transferase CaiB-like acyl-CoA transferase
LADDELFLTVLARNDNRDQLRPLLEKMLATRSAQEWFRLLSHVGVPCAPINDVRGGVQLAEELGLEPVVQAGGVNTIRHPIRMSQTPARYDLAPPSIGEHDEEIRAWITTGKDPR